MNDRVILSKINKIMENIGIFASFSDENEFFLSEYIEDSIAFISLIVEIEEEFGIEIPDDFLSMDMLETSNDIVNMIQKLL